MFRKIVRKILLILIISLIITGALAFGYFAFAAKNVGKGCTRNTSIKLQVPILGYKCVNSFPAYIMFMYKFLVGSIGLVAVVMIMIGGFQWLLAAGNSQRIEGAKTTIFSAIAGLLIALGSFTILNIINPNLTSLKVAALPTVTGVVVQYETCLNKPEYECGRYYFRDKNGKPVIYDGKYLYYQGGSQKELINKKKEEKNLCKGIYCSVAANEVGGCFPDFGSYGFKNEFGEPYKCIKIACPAADSDDAKKGCGYYNKITNFYARKILCNEDRCKLSKKNSCETTKNIEGDAFVLCFEK